MWAVCGIATAIEHELMLQAAIKVENNAERQEENSWNDVVCAVRRDEQPSWRDRHLCCTMIVQH